MAIQVKLYTSTCPRNEYYQQSLEKMLCSSGLDYTLERVTDEARSMRWGWISPASIITVPAAKPCIKS